MPQRRRGRADRTERVGDVLAVRPGLHDPRRERRRRAHLRPVPRDRASRGRRVASLRPCRRVASRNHASSSAPARPRYSAATRAVNASTSASSGSAATRNASGSVDRERGRLVEVGEVAHLVARSTSPSAGVGVRHSASVSGHEQRARARASRAARSPSSASMSTGIGYLPCQRGGRRSRNARGPSCASSLRYTGSHKRSAQSKASLPSRVPHRATHHLLRRRDRQRRVGGDRLAEPLRGVAELGGRHHFVHQTELPGSRARRSGRR